MGDMELESCEYGGDEDGGKQHRLVMSLLLSLCFSRIPDDGTLKLNHYPTAKKNTEMEMIGRNSRRISLIKSPRRVSQKMGRLCACLQR